MRFSFLSRLFSLLLLLSGILEAAHAEGAGSLAAIREETYRKLDQVRAQRRAQLEAYLARIQQLADGVDDDEIMQKFFHVRLAFRRLGERRPPTPEAGEAIRDLEAAVRKHYLDRYLAFYDILFVDRDGTIFHTIRQEADCERNIFEGELAKTRLGQQLRNRPGESFVDYEFYSISNEPSAFFVEPVRTQDGPRGWIVLQCAINKINEMFVRDPGLGRTGEVFLVNRHQQMLTQSRFRPENSILRQHLSAANIESKFREGKGHKTVTDYRGYRAITSFEVCPVLGSEWLLIAKIDEDEVLTREYLANRSSLEEPLFRAIPPPPGSETGGIPWTSKIAIVDIDEFRKTGGTASLATFGVTTCTALAIRLPGEFGYLGHASTYDRIYGGGDMDLLGHMLKRIHTFDIYPYQARSLRACTIAPHDRSVRNAVHRLLEDGFLLSQIRVLQDTDARSASVFYDVVEDDILVEWKGDTAGAPAHLSRASEVPSLGEVLRKLLEN